MIIYSNFDEKHETMLSTVSFPVLGSQLELSHRTILFVKGLALSKLQFFSFEDLGIGRNSQI
jgi:hypothetical protein